MESNQYLVIISHLVFVYGDKCSDDEFIISQQIYDYLLQIIHEIFQKQNLNNFLKNNKLQKELYNLKKIKHYLSFILGEVVQNFFQFKNIQEKVHRSTQTDNLSVTKESRKDFLQNLLQQKDQINQNSIDILKLEQKVFISKRVDKMTDEQFDKFNYLRYRNFLEFGDKSFQIHFKLQDFFNKIKIKKRQQLTSLINYIFCKFIEGLIHRVIKLRDINKILNPIQNRISLNEIKQQGNKMLMKIVQNKNIYLCKLEKNLEKEAFKLFEKDFYSQSYDLLLNLSKVNNNQNIIENSWKKMVSYKSMWVQRVQAQQQLALMEKNEIKVGDVKGRISEIPNKYLEYLVNQLTRMNKVFLSESSSEELGKMFKDYLINNKNIIQPIPNIQNTVNKKVKLESVFEDSESHQPEFS